MQINKPPIRFGTLYQLEIPSNAYKSDPKIVKEEIHLALLNSKSPLYKFISKTVRKNDFDKGWYQQWVNAKGGTTGTPETTKSKLVYDPDKETYTVATLSDYGNLYILARKLSLPLQGSWSFALQMYEKANRTEIPSELRQHVPYPNQIRHSSFQVTENKLRELNLIG